MRTLLGLPLFDCLATKPVSRRSRNQLKAIEITPPPAENGSPQQPFPTSSVVALLSGSFYIDHGEKHSLHVELQGGRLRPATVMTLQDASIPTIQKTIDHFLASDDVFSTDFLRFLVLVGTKSSSRGLLKDKKLNRHLSELGITHVATVGRQLAEDAGLVDGPYMASVEGFHRVWKLFPDRQGAFVASVVQKMTGEFTNLNASTAEASPNLAVAVPSRLYFTVTPEKPLHGLRVAIKDNIDIAGVKTFASSKCYGELYGTAWTSAATVQRLLNLGAIVVGKTGMSQFADAEDPTADFVDFHAPSNPRGDGLRSAGGSSFGAGAATGAYKWLDFAVATDTGGSVRQPAASQSVFGFRPSHGALSIQGVIQIHEDLDMVGFLSKDFEVLKQVTFEALDFSKVMKQVTDHALDLKASKQSATEAFDHDILRNAALFSACTRHLRPKIIYPSHLFPVVDEAANSLYEHAVSSLERMLQVDRRVVNFTEEWARSHDDNTEALEDYFAPVLYGYVTWGQYRGRSSFRRDYQAKFGRQPYMNPLLQMRFEDGERMSEEEFSALQEKRKEFQSFIEGIFGSNSIMITPFKFGEPEARDVYRPAPSQRDRCEFGWGLRQAFQSPMAGQPEVVFPVGQRPVFSTVSKVEENYGVIASIIGSKGMDKALLEITDQLLTEMKAPKSVLTGRVPYKD